MTHPFSTYFNGSGNLSALDFAALVVPLSMLFVAMEYIISRLQKKKYFSFESSVVNLSIGVAERVLNLFILGVFYGIFDYLQKTYGLFAIPDTLLNGLLLFLAVDFIWYWYHRLGHEVNILWSAHIVHHQSEEFNYTVSARITIFQAVVRNAFWCVLPLLGFSAESIALCLLIHGIYPFFIHTRTIGKLGPLEYIFVTPSHHRVHHASNEMYLDRNYGDVLIIWDKLFGTFRKETEEPVYGLTYQLSSYSFLWQHFHQLLELLYTVRKTDGLANRLNLIFGKPDRIPSSIREQLEAVFLTERFIRTKNKKIHLKLYISVQVGLSLLLLFVLTLMHNYLELSVLLAGTVFILLTLINCGAILDQKRWVFYPECARGMLLLGTTAFYFPHPWLLAVIVCIACLAFYYFEQAEKKFMYLLYGVRINQND